MSDLQGLHDGIYVSKTLLSKVKVDHSKHACGYQVLAWWTKKPLHTIMDECVALKDSDYAPVYLKTWAQELKGAFMRTQTKSTRLPQKYYCNTLVCKFICILLIRCSSLIVPVYAVAAYAKEHNCTIILLDDAKDISGHCEVKQVR